MVTRSPSAPPKPRPAGLTGAPAAMRKCFVQGGLTWVDVMYPTRDEVFALGEHHQFHPLHIEDVLSRIQRPKIDDEAGYVFLVLHFPLFDKVERLSVISEVDIFVGQDFVITFHDGRLRPLRRLTQTAADERGSELLLGRGSGFLLYRIIEALINYCFPMLYRLDEKLDDIEEALFKPEAQRVVQDLSYIRRDIIALRRIIRPNIPVVRLLAGRERDYLHLDEEQYFGDLVDGLNRLWDMLEEQKEIIEGLDSTLFNVMSNRLNQEMKLFTLITVILGPMTLIASILGMNVSIPYANNPWALPAVLLAMVLIGAGLFLYFRHKRLV
ncbi:MAG: magnesium transporter CorA family protein [Chloroflexales bacterium]|nr:magnesium transporter CorA family protein [Chloroflexales bacterium]